MVGFVSFVLKPGWSDLVALRCSKSDSHPDNTASDTWNVLSCVLHTSLSAGHMPTEACLGLVSGSTSVTITFLMTDINMADVGPSWRRLWTA